MAPASSYGAQVPSDVANRDLKRSYSPASHLATTPQRNSATHSHNTTSYLATPSSTAGLSSSGNSVRSISPGHSRGIFDSIEENSADTAPRNGGYHPTEDTVFRSSLRFNDNGHIDFGPAQPPPLNTFQDQGPDQPHLLHYNSDLENISPYFGQHQPIGEDVLNHLDGLTGLHIGNSQGEQFGDLTVPDYTQNMITDQHLLAPWNDGGIAGGYEHLSMDGTISPSLLSKSAEPSVAEGMTPQTTAEFHSDNQYLETPAPRADVPSILTSPALDDHEHHFGHYLQPGGPLGPGSKRKLNPSHLSPHPASVSSEEYEPETEQVGLGLETSKMPGRARAHSTASMYRAGISPELRNEQTMVSLNDDNSRIERLKVTSEIESWLDKTADIEILSNARHYATKSVISRRKSGKRGRARSVGDNPDPSIHLRQVNNQSNIPGPGVLVYEDEKEEDSEEDFLYPGTPDSVVEELGLSYANRQPPPIRPITTSPPVLSTVVHPASPLVGPTEGPAQPRTAHDAMAQYELKVKEWDNASRVATWGSNARRDSNMDMESEDGNKAPNKLRKQSLADRYDANRERRPSFIEEAVESFSEAVETIRGGVEHALKRVPSNSRKSRKESEDSVRETRKDSHDKPSRLSSLRRRSKSPRPYLDTGSAIAASVAPLASVGVSQNTQPMASKWTFKSPVSETANSFNFPHFAHTRQSVPTIPTIPQPPPAPVVPVVKAAPAAKPRPTAKPQYAADEDDDEDDEDDDPSSTKMDLNLQIDPLVPNFQGFQAHIKKLNPRLEDQKLIDRFTQEQVKRYKRLLKDKHEHLVKVGNGTCKNGRLCNGNQSIALVPPSQPRPAKAASNDSRRAEADEREEGLINPSLFPPGIPMPPVTRLPAEFECPLCFEVKKFQKPSDWTKHVHEDVEPFTCTYPECTEMKSFKRKADWVRHENERHRHLEWWNCILPDCSHECYRRDNFMQHLVREHKKPEPLQKSAKKAQADIRARVKQGLTMEQGIARDPANEVWEILEECHHLTSELPTSESCRFCGNKCNSWKRLTVHLGKHLQQISLSTIRMVQQKDINANTQLSPVESRFPAGGSGQIIESPLEMHTSGTRFNQGLQVGAGAGGMYNQNAYDRAATHPAPQPAPGYYQPSGSNAMAHDFDFNQQYFGQPVGGAGQMNDPSNNGYSYPPRTAAYGHGQGQVPAHQGMGIMSQLQFSQAPTTQFMPQTSSSSAYPVQQTAFYPVTESYQFPNQMQTSSPGRPGPPTHNGQDMNSNDNYDPNYFYVPQQR